MDAPVPAEAVLKALRKIVSALQGVGHEPVVIGALAHQAWGVAGEPRRVDLLIPSGGEHREAVLSAARGEGLQQAAGPAAPASLALRYPDAKLGVTVDVGLTEASTPFHKKVLGRAQRGAVLQVTLRLATCEDLILWAAGSDLPEDRETLVALLRGNAGRIDAAYLKQEAQAAGVFDRLKSAWQQARQQP